MSRAKIIISGIFSLIILAAVGYVVWMWGFCRFYVPAGHMAIVIAKHGAPLRPGQILAEAGQKGVQAEPLGEGRHFLNPVTHNVRIVPAIQIPAGKVGVVTCKVGQDLPSGEFIAERHQKGIWRDVLGPGVYRMNPEGYKVDIIDAVSIPIGYVGVITSLSGEQAPEGKFATATQKGVMSDVLQPGLYYLNPKAYQIDVLEIGLNQVTLTGRGGSRVVTKSKMDINNSVMATLQQNVLAEQAGRRADYLSSRSEGSGSSYKRYGRQAADSSRNVDRAVVDKSPRATPMASFELPQVVEFPSRDGFEVRLDMTVEFTLQPSKVAWTFLHYGDLPAVVDKVILPQILSVSRLKGSSYKAQDFIVGEGRERFQDDLRDSLMAVLANKGIEIHNSLIRHVELPREILLPIQQGSVAREQNLTNKERQNTARKQAELNISETMIEQHRQKVAQETEKLVAEIKADTELKVANIHAQTQLEVAAIDRQRAEVTAETTRTIGQVEADIIRMVEGEKADGLRKKAEALDGGRSLAWLKFAESLNPDLSLRIIHAGEGTLWTDLNGATVGEMGGIDNARRGSFWQPAKK